MTPQEKGKAHREPMDKVHWNECCDSPQEHRYHKEVQSLKAEIERLKWSTDIGYNKGYDDSKEVAMKVILSLKDRLHRAIDMLGSFAGEFSEIQNKMFKELTNENNK